LTELLKTKGKQLNVLDFSNIVLTPETLAHGMTDSFAHMRNLSELNLSECFSDGRSMEVKKFIDTLFSKCTSLKSVDLSKNALSKDNMTFLLKIITGK